MADVVRQDVIQIGFDIDNSPLQEILKELKELKESIGAATDTDGFDDMKDSVDDVKKSTEKAKESVEGLGDSTEKTKKGFKEFAQTSLEKLKSSLQNIKSKLTEIAKKAGSAALSALKKIAGVSFKALAAGITGAATAIGTIVTKSVQAFADYEQLVGGVDTLFKDSSKIVQQYANNAYKTAGLSANDYMETVTGFSASLLQSLGGDTKKAAEYADVAISDMADNSNKMGTSMESIQYAYQGFAKQNYTIETSSRAA